MSTIDDLHLDQTAKRIRRLFPTLGHMSAPELGRAGSSEASFESSQGGVGALPGMRDVQAISERLLAANRGHRQLGATEAEAMATSIVRKAQNGLMKLEGAPDWVLDTDETMALEAVVQGRGQLVAVRVMRDTLDDIRQYPGADMWAMLADAHITRILASVSAAAAVRVTDKLLPSLSWVQGTAFLISRNLALTNRHVLFPPAYGTRLARRVPGTTTARLKGEYEICLDFAFDSGEPRDSTYRIVDIPFVSEDADPVDAALLKVEHRAGAEPDALTISRDSIFDIDRLYVVGHPGRLASVPDDIQMVFDNPDERKRVSFGKLMDPVVSGQAHIVHDAPTIGGYSGAAVHGFADTSVHALHYWGDAREGNRAIAATALRNHPTLGSML